MDLVLEMEVKDMAVPTTLDLNISHLRTGLSIKSSWKLENGTMLQKAIVTYRNSVHPDPDKVENPDHLPRRNRNYLFFGNG